MPRFRSYRGSRRRSGIPRSTVRSNKYIVNIAAASEAAGVIAVTMALGTDNATLGQSSTIDTAVPVGAKISKIEIFMPKVNLAATANFVHWSIQRTLSGQSVINPILAGGNSLRRNIMLQGVVGLGEGQNNQLHVTFKIPPKYQRIGDGDLWGLVHNNTGAVSTTYQFIYKIFM